MTGRVPYYGGRITPTMAYAIDHPDAPVQTQWHPAYQMGSPGLAPSPTVGAGGSTSPEQELGETLRQLDALLARGALTPEEHARIAARVRA